MPAAPDGAAWEEAARSVAASTGVPIDAYRVGAAGLADRGDFPAIYGISAAGAVLIRPDGHVAWRHAGADDGADPTLRAVVGRLTTGSDGETSRRT